MANLKIEGLKCSEVLEITAAVVKVMEDAADFNAMTDPDLIEKDGTCSILFRKAQTSLEELTKIQSRLGRNFKIDVEAATKEELAISLKAGKNEFTQLIGKQLEQKTSNPGLNFKQQ